MIAGVSESHMCDEFNKCLINSLSRNYLPYYGQAAGLNLSWSLGWENIAIG